MAKEFTPDPEAVLAATVARHGKALEKLTGDVGALGKSMAEVLGLLRDSHDKPASSGKDDDEPRPDWLGLNDPDAGRAAVSLLRSIERWTTRVLPYLRGAHASDNGGKAILPLKPCWRWHPAAVIELSLIRVHYAEAMNADSGAPIADYLGRWLPAALEAVRVDLSGCEWKSTGLTHKPRVLGAEGSRYTFHAGYSVDIDAWPGYATWWATSDRTGLPPGLNPLPDRVPTQNGSYRR